MLIIVIAKNSNFYGVMKQAMLFTIIYFVIEKKTYFHHQMAKWYIFVFFFVKHFDVIRCKDCVVVFFCDLYFYFASQHKKHLGIVYNIDVEIIKHQYFINSIDWKFPNLLFTTPVNVSYTIKTTIRIWWIVNIFQWRTRYWY